MRAAVCTRGLSVAVGNQVGLGDLGYFLLRGLWVRSSLTVLIPASRAGGDAGLVHAELQPPAVSCLERAFDGAGVLRGGLHGASGSQATLAAGHAGAQSGRAPAGVPAPTGRWSAEQGKPRRARRRLQRGRRARSCGCAGAARPSDVSVGSGAFCSPFGAGRLQFPTCCYSPVAVFANLKKMCFQNKTKRCFQASAPICISRWWTGGAPCGKGSVIGMEVGSVSLRAQQPLRS